MGLTSFARPAPLGAAWRIPTAAPASQTAGKILAQLNTHSFPSCSLWLFAEAFLVLSPVMVARMSHVLSGLIRIWPVLDAGSAFDLDAGNWQSI